LFIIFYENIKALEGVRYQEKSSSPIKKLTDGNFPATWFKDSRTNPDPFMDQRPDIGNRDDSRGEKAPRASLAPSTFTIENRVVMGMDTPEEGDEILAEFDFLFHYARKVSMALGGKKVEQLILKEEQSLLAFHVLGGAEIRGYQSSRPYPWVEAFHLF
jgi:hypothetical protein